MKPLYKFALQFLYLIPIVLTVILCNYKIDPANLFKNNDYEIGIATLLAQGKYVTNVTNYDARILQKTFLEKIKVSPDVLVLSSSRGMYLNSDVFPDKKVINAFVQSGTLEDFMALYDICETQKISPKKVILVLDARILNKNNPRVKYKPIESNYKSMRKKIGLPATQTDDDNILTDKRWQLLSISYFQAAVKSLKKKDEEAQSSYYPVSTRYNKEDTRLPDGSMAYAKKRRAVDSIEIKKLAVDYISKPITTDMNFTELSKTDEHAFESFVKYLKSKNVAVEFFFAPFHPIVYEFFATSKEYGNGLVAERYFRQFAQQNSIPVYGSYNPAPYKLNGDGFYDALHCKESTIKLVYNMGPRVNDF